MRESSRKHSPSRAITHCCSLICHSGICRGRSGPVSSSLVHHDSVSDWLSDSTAKGRGPGDGRSSCVQFSALRCRLRSGSEDSGMRSGSCCDAMLGGKAVSARAPSGVCSCCGRSGGSDGGRSCSMVCCCVSASFGGSASPDSSGGGMESDRGCSSRPGCSLVRGGSCRRAGSGRGSADISLCRSGGNVSGARANGGRGMFLGGSGAGGGCCHSDGLRLDGDGLTWGGAIHSLGCDSG